MTNRKAHWLRGMGDGIPICLGYIAVSFTFGIMARNTGLSPLQAVVLSGLNLTSAGQFAGLSLIAAASPYLEMALTQLVINLRYCLMSCSLSQKVDPAAPFFHRFLMSYGISDEIFGVSVSVQGPLSPFYSYGLMSVAVPGWVLGTLLGVISGSLLPARVVTALSVALYGMFLAIIIPPARKSRVLRGIVLLSMGMSFLFSVLPILSRLSEGMRIILLTFLIAGAAAVLFPVKEEGADAG